MILYARTINDVRRYFAELDMPVSVKDQHLIDFLILPTSDKKPPFFESWRAMFWQVLMIGFIDSLVAGVAIISLTGIKLILVVLIGLGILGLHFYIYWSLAYKHENEWNIHFPIDLQKPNL